MIPRRLLSWLDIELTPRRTDDARGFDPDCFACRYAAESSADAPAKLGCRAFGHRRSTNRELRTELERMAARAERELAWHRSLGGTL